MIKWVEAAKVGKPTRWTHTHTHTHAHTHESSEIKTNLVQEVVEVVCFLQSFLSCLNPLTKVCYASCQQIRRHLQSSSLPVDLLY